MSNWNHAGRPEWSRISQHVHVTWSSDRGIRGCRAAQKLQKHRRCTELSTESRLKFHFELRLSHRIILAKVRYDSMNRVSCICCLLVSKEMCAGAWILRCGTDWNPEQHGVKPSCEAWEMQVVLKSVKTGSQTPIDDILVKEGQSYGSRMNSMRNYRSRSRLTMMPRQTKLDLAHATLHSCISEGPEPPWLHTKKWPPFPYLVWIACSIFGALLATTWGMPLAECGSSGTMRSWEDPNHISSFNVRWQVG